MCGIPYVRPAQSAYLLFENRHFVDGLKYLLRGACNFIFQKKTLHHAILNYHYKIE